MVGHDRFGAHLIQGLSNPDWEARRLLGMTQDWRDRTRMRD
jgi:hypothetical protein